MWDELRARHPGLVIDLCASGGRRIDLEALQRGLPLWHSDMQCSGKPSPAADQLQNAGLWRWVPMHGCGNFAYEPSYAFRSAMTAGNILAVGNKAGPVQHSSTRTRRRAVRRTVAIYRKLRPFMVGDFYPLFPHSDSEEAWFGYQFHRPDLNAGAAILFRREKSKDAKKPVAAPGGRAECAATKSASKTLRRSRPCPARRCLACRSRFPPRPARPYCITSRGFSADYFMCLARNS